jgi:glycosyltransferase involved in cell wall biosynthesis
MRRHFDRFDVLISAYNIADFSRPGIHFLADFSWDETLRRNLDPPPPGLRKVLHVIPPARHAYLAATRVVAAAPAKRDLRIAGLVLANSEWSREILRERHGIESVVLYPPLPMRLAAKPSERKLRRFVSLGRIYPEKRIEQMVEIAKAVRARGHDLSLHIIGDMRETAYGREIEGLCRAEGGWIVLEGRQFGEAKTRLLAESAFGIHARAGEAFGIAVAEMIMVGCIPFVPAYGGAAEIVKHNSALVYDAPEDAVNKIDRMLKDSALEAATRASLVQRARDFSTESFMRGIRRVVSEFVASQSRPHQTENNPTAL